MRRRKCLAKGSNKRPGLPFSGPERAIFGWLNALGISGRATQAGMVMGTAESYRSYAADCVRQAEAAKSSEEKNVLLNVALAWIRLAHQKQAVKEPHTVKDLDAVKEASAAAAKIDAKMAAKIVNLEQKRAAMAAPAVQSPA
jgi:hypothetical protein